MGRRRASRQNISPAKLIGYELEIEHIFKQVQHNADCHEKHIKNLKRIYSSWSLNPFFECFKKCLQVSLMIGEKSPAVERTLTFCAQFSTSLESSDDSDSSADTLDPFLIMLFEYLLDSSDSKHQAFRFRVCQFIDVILLNFGENAELEDDMCERLLNCLLTRMQDIKHQVRTQAVIALHRLQDVRNPDDPVTKAYAYHMESDQSAQVRRAAMNNIARSQYSMGLVVQRIRDVDEKVRRDAYIALSHYKFRSFKIRQRIDILCSGLEDRSPLVKKCVTQVLLPKWWLPFKENFFEFLKALKFDSNFKSIQESIKVSELTLNIYFKETPIEEIMSALLIDNASKFIQTVNYEVALYWRCLLNFLSKEKLENQLEDILPEMTPYCENMKKYLSSVKKDMNEWEKVEHQATLLQLLEITMLFDLCDEVGRNNLKQLIIDMLLNEELIDKVVEQLIKLFFSIVGNYDDVLQQLSEVISDIIEPMQPTEAPINEDVQRENNMKMAQIRYKINILEDDQEKAIHEEDFEAAMKLKSQLHELRAQLRELSVKPVVQQIDENRVRSEDPEQLCKALDVIIAMLYFGKERKLPPILRSLQQNLIMEYCAMTQFPEVQTRALRAIAMCTYLDLPLAKNIIHIFYIPVMSYKYVTMPPSVIIVCISAICDLILLYGLDEFAISENDETCVENKTKRTLFNKTQLNTSGVLSDIGEDEPANSASSTPPSVTSNELLSNMIGLLDHEDESIRTKMTDCLCRLYVQKRLTSVNILSRLIIIWFNPATDNDNELKQTVGVMMLFYAENVSGSTELFEKSLMVVLSIIDKAPMSSPLKFIDREKVIKFIITCTKPGYNQKDNYNAHTNLMLKFCEYIRKDPDSSLTTPLIKSLHFIEIPTDDRVFTMDLHKRILGLIEHMDNKIHITLIKKFISKLLNVTVSTEATESMAGTTISDSTRLSRRVSVVSMQENNVLAPGTDSEDEETRIENVESPVKVTNQKNVIISSSSSDQDDPDTDSDSESDDDLEYRKAMRSRILKPAEKKMKF